MREDRVLVKLYIPKVELQYNVFLPLRKPIYEIINLLVKAVNELCGGYYNPEALPMLYDKLTAKPYDINKRIIDSTIRNGTELVLI